jgi:hypothetical protein
MDCYGSCEEFEELLKQIMEEQNAAKKGRAKPAANQQVKRSQVKEEAKKSPPSQGGATAVKTTPPKRTLPPWTGMRDFGRPKNWQPRSAPSLGPRNKSDRITKEPRAHSAPSTPVKIRSKRPSNPTTPLPQSPKVIQTR